MSGIIGPQFGRIPEWKPVSDPAQAILRPFSPGPREWIAVGISLLVVSFFVLMPTTWPLGKLDAVAYAVCHRIPERSIFIAGQQLPLCARCSGTFLGVLMTMVGLTLSGRTRASRLPPPRVLTVLVGFILLWAIDGFNSYLTLFPGAPHLYGPQNWLRLTTGVLNGLALGTLVFAILHFSLWRTSRPQPVIADMRELARLIIPAALVVVLAMTGNAYLLYPLAIVSTLGVLAMLTSVNTVIVLVTSHSENSAHHWRDAALPILIALAFSLMIILGIGAGRAALTRALELPF